MTQHDVTNPIDIPLDELRARTTALAERWKGAEISGELRGEFIAVRTALFQRGIYDPVLVRFDSATAPRASSEEIAEQLASVAASMQI